MVRTNPLVITLVMLLPALSLASDRSKNTISRTERQLINKNLPSGQVMLKAVKDRFGPSGRSILVITQPPNRGGPIEAFTLHNSGRATPVPLRQEWMGDGLGRIVHRKGVTVIMQEVVTGFGRNATKPFQFNQVVRFSESEGRMIRAPELEPAIEGLTSAGAVKTALRRLDK